MSQIAAILIGMAIGCSGLVLAYVLDWIIRFVDRIFSNEPSYTPNSDDLEDQYK